MENKAGLIGFVFRILLCVVFISSSAAFGEMSDSQSEQPVKYELKLESENIKRLILQRDNRKETFEMPGKSIMLEPGTYQISELHLQSNLIHFPYLEGKRLESVKVGPGETPVLKAGGPLEQQITVQRAGQLLQMQYHLRGAAGELYRNDRRYPPKFAIYKGEKEITSGKFRFG